MTAPVRAEALLDGRWVVDPSSTRAGFVARDVLRQPVAGTLTVTSAHVDVVDGLPCTVAARLDLRSVATGSARRDRDLRGPRFFDVDRCPELVFTGGPAVPAPDGWELSGVLGLRGVECAVRLHVQPAGGGKDLRVLATTRLDRRELGIRVPRLLVGSTVDVTVAALLLRPATRAASGA